MDYQQINADTIDSWCGQGWKWGIPVSHEEFEQARQGKWEVYLTPTKTVPHGWLEPLAGKRILGLASGGGQQIPIFSALGAHCTVLDYSPVQCESERMVADREGYEVEVIRGDMTKPLPFEDETFDLIFHPVSNCYVRQVLPVFRECARVLKTGGVMLSGLDLGLNYIFDETETFIQRSLPFDPVADPELMKMCLEEDWGVQFSHTLEEQLGGQLAAGLILTHLYEDTNEEGNLHDHHVPTFAATRAVKVPPQLRRALTLPGEMGMMDHK